MGHRLAASQFESTRRPKATDWNPVFQFDDAKLLNLLPVWVPDAATRKKILVENPGRLYGF